MQRRYRDLALAALAVALVGMTLWHILSGMQGVRIEALDIDGTPARIYRPAAASPGPVVVVAHGFAGSQQLMAAFAVTFARNGYTAVTFDFLGHGRNPRPLAGDVAREDGATRALVAETAKVARFARGLGDGRLALLGHSMASDVVVRAAVADPTIAATIAVSMFSRVVTATSPRDLLVISGEWEGALRAEALRAVGLATPEPAREGVAYGSLSAGTARRAVVAGSVEHVGVLYSRDSLRESLAWLDAAFGRPVRENPDLDRRGPWILALMTGIVVLARPLSTYLPAVADRPLGAGLPWRRLWPVLVVPALATPLILRLAPTDRLGVPVGGYLAAHFALYGLLTWAMVWWAHRHDQKRTGSVVRPGPFLAALAGLLAFDFVTLGWSIDSFVTSFVPNPARLPLIGLMLAGTAAFFTADEWATRGPGAARFAYAGAKLAFLVSLGLAIALDFQALFFLVIILPVVVPAFVVYGLFSAWTYRRTRHPLVAGVANAVVFAWALGVTFPILAR